MESFEVANEKDWTNAWEWLSPKLMGRKVIALEGDLGSGKTTFVKAILAAMGVKGEVTSPTFSLVQQYPIGDKTAYHFDLYRLKSTEEVLDIDFESYLDTGQMVFVEWPAVASPFLTQDVAVWLRIEHIKENSRRLTMT